MVCSTFTDGTPCYRARQTELRKWVFLDTQQLLHKLAQIEEHTNDALREFPQLAKERLRMIQALVRQLRSEHVAESSAPGSEAGVRAAQEDDSNARSG